MFEQLYKLFKAQQSWMGNFHEVFLSQELGYIIC